MTPKREKVLWLVYALVLVLLFLMSSTNLIIKDKETEVYPISIIVDDTTDEFYVNFRKGVDQAAFDYHADVSFITMYDENRADQQMELVSRELNDGARAIILSPVGDKAIVSALDDMTITGPLVVINSVLSHDRISYNIAEDYYELGKTLAEAVADNTPEGMQVCMVTENPESSTNTMTYDGMQAVFDERGIKTKLVKALSEEGCRSLIESMVYPEHTEYVLVAVDVKSLARIAGIIAESTVYQRYASGVYGPGSTLQILNYLDEGIIDGVVVTNEFVQGYLSIQKAVEAIENTGFYNTTKMEHHYIEKEDIRKKEFQKLLYPVD